MFNTCFRGRVLVIAPHYDDEVIGCGGTLLRFREQIDRLVIVHLSAASDGREAKFGKVSAILSVNEHYAFRQNDGFCWKDSKELTLALVRAIQVERPDVVLVPHRAEAHADHRASWWVTLDAVEKARFWELVRPARPHRVPTLLAYEVWTALPHPSVVFDVTEYFESKCSLLRLYASEAEDFPYLDYIRAFNSWRGLVHHRSGQAEAFAARCI